MFFKIIFVILSTISILVAWAKNNDKREIVVNIIQCHDKPSKVRA